MIKCHLSKLMGERKLKVIDVARATGLNRSTISALYREEAARIEISAMDTLCCFFDCSVCDLFEFIPNNQPECSEHPNSVSI